MEVTCETSQLDMGPYSAVAVASFPSHAFAAAATVAVVIGVSADAGLVAASRTRATTPGATRRMVTVGVAVHW